MGKCFTCPSRSHIHHNHAEIIIKKYFKTHQEIGVMSVDKNTKSGGCAVKSLIAVGEKNLLNISVLLQSEMNLLQSSVEEIGTSASRLRALSDSELDFYTRRVQAWAQSSVETSLLVEMYYLLLLRMRTSRTLTQTTSLHFICAPNVAIDFVARKTQKKP